jgi:hypothetical protein
MSYTTGLEKSSNPVQLIYIYRYTKKQALTFPLAFLHLWVTSQDSYDVVSLVQKLQTHVTRNM